jgi:hypothetical protein
MSVKNSTGDYAMPGISRKMPKKMRGGGGAAKPKAMPLKRGGGVRGRGVRGRGQRSMVPGPSFEVAEQTGPRIVPDESGGRKKLKPAPQPVPATMLPRDVRNNMGFMRDGGAVKKKMGGGVSKSAVRSSSKKPL